MRLCEHRPEQPPIWKFPVSPTRGLRFPLHQSFAKAKEAANTCEDAELWDGAAPET